MYKYSLVILVALGAGVVLSHFIYQRDVPDKVADSATIRPQLKPEAESSVLQSNPFVALNDQSAQETFSEPLLERMKTLEQRVEILEQALTDSEQTTLSQADSVNNDSSVDTPASASHRILNAEDLVKAGLDKQRASDIVRRKNQLELQKLELRDRASREGYLGTVRYSNELMELNRTKFSLREELGDTLYDRYLYASGAANRVRAVSIMAGSAADQAGMLKGDQILEYNETSIFDWNELRQLTTQGERDEYVSVEILRENQRLTLWLPRGPLGVRLGTARTEPGG